MSEFILFRLPDSIGPSFNEVSQRLAADKDVTIKDKMEKGPFSMMLVETADAKLPELEKALPGWLIEPNGKFDLC